MPQSAHQRRASDRVAAWLEHNYRDPAWLAETTETNLGIITEFLYGRRWLTVGTQRKIERALGWPSTAIQQIGKGVPPASAGAFVQDPAFIPGTPRLPSPSGREGMSDGRVLAALQEIAEALAEINDRLSRLEEHAIGRDERT